MSKRNRENDASKKRKKKKKKSKKITKAKVELEIKKEDGNVVDSQIINPDSSNVVKKQPSKKKKSLIHSDEDKPTFFRKRAKLSISLLPWSLRDCKQSVESSIRKMLLKYSDGLGGVLMAYDDIELQDREGDSKSKGKGWVLNELPHVHYDVSCNVLVFSPSVGCELKGVVNECFPSHVGILIFDYINAMVSAETIREAGYKFDLDLQTWTMEGDSITSGVKINFVVTKIHECNGTISLEGAKPARSLLVDT
mmetsp:Transcript_56730/g.61459  ORF Transcript_56730/g.61459 Transcript_56730/m.61459 type:complete len:252 (-) Transcript_56730:151-906(-)